MQISILHKPNNNKYLRLYNASSSKPDESLKQYNWAFASRRLDLDNRSRAEVLAEDKQEDAVVTAPIVIIENKPHIIFTLHNRPALYNKDSHGLHWEVVGGLTNDQEAKTSVWQTSDNEVRGETGLEVTEMGKIDHSRFKRLANSAGLTDETTRCDVTICSIPKDGFDLDKITEDTIMCAYAVPLKDAVTFLHEQTQKNFNVGLNTLAATTNAQRVLEVPFDFEGENIKPTKLWDLKDANKVTTQLQKEGFENKLYQEHFSAAA